MKTIGEYKQLIASIIIQMEEEHGCSVKEVHVEVDEITDYATGRVIDRKYNVSIEV